MAQHPFQMKRPRAADIDKEWGWPGEIPATVLFDPLSTVSATYGVAFQTQFRGGPRSSRPTIFVIDGDGVLRYVDSRPEEDIREEGIFPALDDLEEQRQLIAGFEAAGEARRAAGRRARAPL